MSEFPERLSLPGLTTQMRHKRKEALAACDCVVLAGSVIDFRVDYGRHFNKNAHITMINLGAEALAKNRDIRGRDLLVQADPADFVVSLAQNAPATDAQRAAWQPWLAALRKNEAKREAEIDGMARSKKPSTSAAAGTERGINPVVLCRAVNDAIADDSIIVADGGDFVGTASYIVQPRQPLAWLDPGVFGTLGVGGGFAVAAKALRPNSEVWILFGDGSSAWSLSEVDTMVRHGLPCIVLIGNDAAWQQMHRDQVRMVSFIVQRPIHSNRFSRHLFSHNDSLLNSTMWIVAGAAAAGPGRVRAALHAVRHCRAGLRRRRIPRRARVRRGGDAARGEARGARGEAPGGGQCLSGQVGLPRGIHLVVNFEFQDDCGPEHGRHYLVLSSTSFPHHWCAADLLSHPLVPIRAAFAACLSQSSSRPFLVFRVFFFKKRVFIIDPG